jgi:hypothetical protein
LPTANEWTATAPESLLFFSNAFPPSNSESMTLLDWNGKRYKVNNQGYKCHKAFEKGSLVFETCGVKMTQSIISLDEQRYAKEDKMEKEIAGIPGLSEEWNLRKVYALSVFFSGFSVFAASSVLSGILAIERNTRKD